MSTRKVDLSFIEILLVIIAFNSCDGCNCNNNPTHQDMVEIRKSIDTLIQSQNKIQKLTHEGP